MVAVRSVQNGLVTHFMYFKDEVRDFGQIPKAEDAKVPKREIDLGRDLIDKMSSADFEPEKYHDECRKRFLAMIDKKVKGQEITVSPPSPERGRKVVDIFAALKQSPEQAASKTPSKPARKRRRA